MSTSTVEMNRRSFLRASALAGGGLVLGFGMGASLAQAAVEVVKADSAEGLTNAFLRIGVDGTVTLYSFKPEVGQGIRTSLPMLIAEELDVPWESIRVETSPLNEATYGWQGAGGSSSTPGNYQKMRQIGASARALLVEAAAARWNVPTAELTTESGFVIHAASQRKVGYGDLAIDAAKLTAPDPKSLRLKDRADFKIIGQRIGGVDNQKLVRGEPLFGLDQKKPGTVYAVYVKCPVFGGKVVSANLDAIKRQPGVVDAFLVEGTSSLNGLKPGVAIVAKSTWEALSARKQLAVVWDEGVGANESWSGFLERAGSLASQPPEASLLKVGDIKAGFAASAKVVEADYHFPFLSHATLEPQNCFAHFDGELLHILAPSQNPGDGLGQAASATGLPKEKIRFTMTRMGGGFGRRLMSDFVAEVAAIAYRIKVPVKLTWTREDDMAHDHYRPAGFFRLKGGVNAAGSAEAWQCHFITMGNEPGKTGNGAGVSGDEFPTRFIPHVDFGHTVQVCRVPMGWWRAPGSCTTAWVMQCFVDELAAAAGRDPLAFRLELLGDKNDIPPENGRGPAFSPRRAAGVLKLAAEKANWGKSLPKGQGQGIAFHFSHLGYVAQVAEVSVSQSGELVVSRVVATVDVGAEIINPSGAENQVEGSIVDGLSAAWLQSLAYEKGRMVQSNFHDYPLLRMTAAPKIETHFLRTDNPVTGLGEPALPPLAPAVCNAIYAATGKRIRSLPFSTHDLSWS